MRADSEPRPCLAPFDSALGTDSTQPLLELTDSIRAELLEPAEWSHALERAARGTGLALALADTNGALFGPCHNAQPVWSLARRSARAHVAGECPFCLLPERPCTAVRSALETREPVVVADQAKLAHIAIPLTLGGESLGVLLAGQVFEQFPEQLPIEAIARRFGVSAQALWQLARRQRPFGRDRLRTCGELLWTLAATFLKSRLGVINERMRAAQTLALSRDVAEHRRLTAALRQSQQQLALITNTVPVFIAACDLDSRYKFVNRPYAERLGLTPEECIGKTIAEVLGDEAYAAIRPRVEQVLAGQAVDFEVSVPYSAIGVHFMRCSYQPERDASGKVVGYVAAIADVTARHRAESALRESEARFRELADAMPQIVWAAGPDGKMDYFNRRWREYAGSSSDDEPWSGASLLHPDDAERTLRTYHSSIEAGRAYECEYRLRDSRAGGYRWFLERAIPSYDENGAVVRWFGTRTDINETKHAEEALRDADRRKDEFLAMLAHELRNPLAPICTAIEIVKARAGGEAGVSRPIAVMQRQTAHMVRLLDDLLEVSRVSRGTIELRCEASDLRAIINHGAETARPLFDRKRQELIVRLPEQPVMVHGDPNRLAQVVGNLLNNASKFTSDAGRAEVTLAARGEHAVIRVTDNGVGLAADQLSRVFDLFVQVDASIERTQGGLGIGLALVRKLVAMHGGRVLAESAGVGQGTTFVVELPRLMGAELPTAASMGQASHASFSAGYGTSQT